MPRKLKTFVTESGFFELAVAAPSMKAALRDWGIDVDLFQQGLARQTEDPGIVAAAEEVPGKVLRRPIGSKAPFQESAELPKVKGVTAKRRAAAKPRHAAKTKMKSPAASHSSAVDLHAIRKARTALHDGEVRHGLKIAALDLERLALDRRAEKLQHQWEREKEKLEKEIARLKA